MFRLFMLFCIPFFVLASCCDGAEFKTGLKLPPHWRAKVNFQAPPEAIALPRNWDWRYQAQLSPIKDQGSCGSCWAFSTVATMQDVMRTKGVAPAILSEQHLLSCNQDGFSCQGGFFAHDMHVSPGAVLSSAYPYTGRDDQCKGGLSYPYKLASWAYIPGGDDTTPPPVESIKSAIYNYGPISVGVAVDNSFQSYRGGVYIQSCNSKDLNHAVNLVGWNDDGQYWIMRNSWGSSWGEGGYMRIRYNCNAIGVAANYVQLTGAPTPPPPPPPPQPQPDPEPTTDCKPLPYADAGPDLGIRPGAIVVIGMVPKTRTLYYWLIDGVFAYELGQFSKTKVAPKKQTTYTLVAKTKCGDAQDSMLVTIVPK